MDRSGQTVLTNGKRLKFIALPQGLRPRSRSGSRSRSRPWSRARYARHFSPVFLKMFTFLCSLPQRSSRLRLMVFDVINYMVTMFL